MRRHTRARRRPPDARRTAVHLIAAALASALVVPVMAAAPASADPAAASFTVPGVYTYVVPNGVTLLDVLAVGGAGGGSEPGGGGVAHAVLAVSPSQRLTVTVAGGGRTGFNWSLAFGGSGDGAGGDGSGYPDGPGGGGGASSVRDASTTTRLVVAGGGGGSAGDSFGPPYCGGAGGGTASPNGSDGCTAVGFSNGGKGATTSAVGAGGGCPGNSPGYAGIGSNGGSAASDGGGGGGGYYGGGGGAADCLVGFPGGGGGGGGGSSYVTPTAIGAPEYGVSPVGGAYADTEDVTNGYVILTPPPFLGLTLLRPSDHCTRGTITNGLNGGVYVKLRAQNDADTNGHAWVCFRVDNRSNVQKGGWLDINPAGRLPGAGGSSVVTNDANSGYCQSPPANYSANTAAGPHPLSSNLSGDPGDLNYVREVFDIYTGTYTDPVTRARHDEAWACLTVTAGGRTDGYRVVVNQSPLAGVSFGTMVTFYPDPGTP